MKIFVDTNVFLDLLLDRENSQAAKQVLRLVEAGMFTAYVADITLLNIDYIAKKQVADVELFLQFITNNFTILGAENREFVQALNFNNSDLEDNIQLFLAEKELCQMVVTNDKTFPQKDITVISSNEFEKYHCL